jgi:hypothetical protein
LQFGEASNPSPKKLDIETPAVGELGAERVRFSTEQVILLVAGRQRVSFVTDGGPKNAFEL